MRHIASSLLQILGAILLVFGVLLAVDGLLPLRSHAPNPAWIEAVIGVVLFMVGWIFRRVARSRVNCSPAIASLLQATPHAGSKNKGHTAPLRGCRVAELGSLGCCTRLKVIANILWFQLVLGLGVAFFAYGDVHSGAMGMEYGRRMQRDFRQMRQAPEFREPAMLTDRGYSLSRLFEDRYTLASDRGRAGLLAFAAGLGASLFAGVLLWLLGRVQRKSHEHTTV
jgi:hypothetical protein